MNDSILTSVKKMLGIEEDYEHFDPDIIMHINAVLMILNQIGLGPKEGLIINDKTTPWSSLIPNEQELGCVRTYVYLKVKLIFDPPLSSSGIEAINKYISELEWRINISVDSGVTNNV